MFCISKAGVGIFEIVDANSENCIWGTLFNAIVKAVYVHAPDKSKGYREQQIDISYDFVGILPASLLNGLQNGETA